MQTLINILGWIMLVQIVLLIVGLIACSVFKKPARADNQTEPKSLRATLEELTSGDADWVAVLPVNEDAAKIEHTRAIDVNAEWTNWEDRRFFGETLEHAAQEALCAKARAVIERRDSEDRAAAPA